jgi:hypothetical protein
MIGSPKISASKSEKRATGSRPSRRATRKLFGSHENWSSSLGGSCVPVAKGETTNDKAVDVHFGASRFIPNALDHGIIPARHTVDRVVLPVDPDDHGACAFAAQLAFCQPEGRPSNNESGNRTGNCANHQQRNGSDDQSHPSAPHIGRKPRAVFLANLLKIEIAFAITRRTL